MTRPPSEPPPATAFAPTARGLALPCALLFGAMLNLTLVVAGLKELVVERLGGTVTEAALFFTVEMTAYLVFGPVWGVLSDRLGRRRPFVVAGFAASGLFYLGFLAVESVPLLLALRFLQGGAAIAGWSTAMALVFDGSTELERPRRAGAAGAAMILGVGTGAPVGGVLTQAFGPHAPLAGAGVLFLVLAIAALALVEPPARRERIGFAAIGRALAERPRLALPAALYFVERFTVGLFVIVFPVFLAERAGADPAARGRYLALFLFPFAFGQLGTYRLTRRFGPLPPLVLGTVLYGLAFGVLERVPVELLGGWMALLGLLAAVIFPPTLALTAEWSSPETRASAIAAFNVAGSAGFALGPVAGARAAEAAGYGVAFQLGGAVAIVGALAAAAAWLAIRPARLSPTVVEGSVPSREDAGEAEGP